MTEAERAAIHAAAAQTAAAAAPIRPEVAERIALLLRGTAIARPRAVAEAGEPTAAAS